MAGCSATRRRTRTTHTGRLATRSSSPPTLWARTSGRASSRSTGAGFDTHSCDQIAGAVPQRGAPHARIARFSRLRRSGSRIRVHAGVLGVRAPRRGDVFGAGQPITAPAACDAGVGSMLAGVLRPSGRLRDNEQKKLGNTVPYSNFRLCLKPPRDRGVVRGRTHGWLGGPTFPRWFAGDGLVASGCQVAGCRARRGRRGRGGLRPASLSKHRPSRQKPPFIGG